MSDSALLPPATSQASDSQEAEVHVDPCLRQRTLQLLRTEINFIPNQEFFDEGFRGDEVAAERLMRSSTKSSGKDLPAHLARLCETALLDAETERELFRQMNYLKFSANALRSRFDPAHPSIAAVKDVEKLMAEAVQIRDHLVQANMRLVMSIIKKFVTPQFSFDDLLSDGIFSLLQAVEKFDYGRGFRFSTYAYRAVARNTYRIVTGQHHGISKCSIEAGDLIEEIPDREDRSLLNEDTWSQLRTLLGDYIKRLDRREQFIIRSRYALGPHRKTRTFQCLADKLGVSKERARQLEQRAVKKLQTMAKGVDIDSIFLGA